MNQITCHRCDEPIKEWCETRRYGFWDDEGQNYDGRPAERRYCSECWNDNEGRANGAHFKPESANHLYAILDAADGDLAAILCWWSGRPAIRVRDGTVECAVTKPSHGGESEDGTPILKFESKLVEDFDREEFDEVADPPEEMGLVRLLDPERTPFGALDGSEVTA